MMTVRDNFVLALTKLRTRPVRLTVTLVISGLLFSVLIAMSLGIRGTIASLTDFTKDGFLDRFITQLDLPGRYTQQMTLGQNPKIVARAQELEKQRRADKAADAKRLGIPYDPAQDPQVVISDAKDPNGKTTPMVNFELPSGRQALSELAPKDDPFAAVTKRAGEYKATGVYRTFRFAGNFGSARYSFSPIIGGKEQAQATEQTGPPDPISSFADTLTAYDGKMLEPFTLPGAKLEAKAGEPLPIFAPYDAAQKLLGMKTLPAKATSAERLQRLKDVRAGAKDLKFEVCFRNQAAIAQQEEVTSQTKLIAERGKDKDFVMPKLLYATSQPVCAPPAIAKDTRTSSEKAQDANAAEFKTKYDTGTPQIERIAFRVVGIVPQTLAGGAGANDFESFVGAILSVNGFSSWSVPYEVVDKQPTLLALTKDPLHYLQMPPTRYVEFPDRESQKAFITKATCQYGPNSSCSDADSVVSTPFGNPLATIYDLSGGFKTFLTWVVGIVAGLSSLIMMGTIGKVVADSRRETSVFRALGARRLQIIQLYGLYAACLGLLSFAVALTIGMLAIGVLDARIAPTVSVSAILAFNVADTAKAFHVFGLNALDLGAVALLTVLTALVSAGIPLATGLRRNPVKDMRDDT